MQGSSWSQLAKASWPLLAFVVVGLSLLIIALYGFPPPIEAIVLLVIALAGGTAVRVFLHDKWVAVALVALVVAEYMVLFQIQGPWLYGSLTLWPSTLSGLIVGDFIRNGIELSKKKVVRDVWVVNGVEKPQTKDAIQSSVNALSSWDSSKSGRFFVERNESLFEAVGSSNSGFIVHCTTRVEEESEWRILGSLEGREESKIPVSYGSAHAPAGIVSNTEEAITALRGYFHHRGPDPKLNWTTSPEVFDFRFEQ